MGVGALYVRRRLSEINKALRNQKMTDSGHLLWTPGAPSPLTPDPRPPLPGGGVSN